MFIQFLTEDKSGGILVEEIMNKFICEHSCIEIKYNIRTYKGIGHYKRGANVQLIKSQQLLSDLAKRLRAFEYCLNSMSDAALFIVMDNDRRDTDVFYNELEEIVSQQNITIDYVFCVAVEEMEAWLLGDITAMQLSYPNLSDRIATKCLNYCQDSICNTWEFMADMLTKGGSVQFYKQNPTSEDIGKRKCEWAQCIGKYLDIHNNRSPSFNRLIYELEHRI